MTRPFDLHLPECAGTGLIFAVPHSGRYYPPDLLERTALDPGMLRSSEDAFVDRLFDAAPACGAPYLVALWPRAWIDLNRSRDELDPALIAGLRRRGSNPRVASGLGVVPRVVAGGRPIYRGTISAGEADARIRDLWVPYHDTLARLVSDCVAFHGRAILVDCHSMPHEALMGTEFRGRAPDVVLGDRYGAAASGEIVERIEQLFVAEGLKVSRNAPFAGAFTARNYGRPAQGQHVVQVEIDRSLYMDEATLVPHDGFAALKAALDRIVAGLTAMGRPDDRPMAAE